MADRSSLYNAKLTGLVRNHTGHRVELVESPGAAGGFVAFDDDARRHGFILAPTEDDRGSGGRVLGPALLWAIKHELGSLSILADGAEAGHLARRAGYFVGGADAFPFSVEVFEVLDTSLAPAHPVPVLAVPELTPSEWALAENIEANDARPVDDHGRLVAEHEGLEVARVVLDRADASDPDSPVLAFLEIGVGQADRELHQLVHRDLDPEAGLRRAVAAVAMHRHDRAAPHPLNRLARERWLRSAILDDPGLLDMRRAAPVPPLRPRDTLLGTQAVALVGEDTAGEPIVAVCSVGVDVDLAAEAADYRERTDPSARLIVVVPARDRYPIVERLIHWLPRAEIVSIDSPWSIDEPGPVVPAR